MSYPAATELLRCLFRECQDERGQTATEYVAVLVVGVGLALALGWFVLAPYLENVIEDIGAFMSTLL